MAEKAARAFLQRLRVGQRRIDVGKVLFELFGRKPWCGIFEHQLFLAERNFNIVCAQTISPPEKSGWKVCECSIECWFRCNGVRIPGNATLPGQVLPWSILADLTIHVFVATL